VPGPTGPQGPTGPKGGVTFIISSNNDSPDEFFVQGFQGANPTLTVVRGERVYIDVSGVLLTNSLALRLSSGSVSTVPGTINNSTVSGRNETSSDPIIIYDVPLNAPSSIIYQDVTNVNVAGVIDIIDKQGPTGPTGPAGPTGTPFTGLYTPVFTASVTDPVGAQLSGQLSSFGKYVSFSIKVDFSTIANVGSGQYRLTLPTLPDGVASNTFKGKLVQGSTVYDIVATHDEGLAVMNLSITGTNGLYAALTPTVPLTINSSTIIYVSGNYIGVE
jgi:hypothetical protein